MSEDEFGGPTSGGSWPERPAGPGMDSLTAQLLHQDVPDGAPCPSCGFRIWVRISEVVTECVVRCPVCRTSISSRKSNKQ